MKLCVQLGVSLELQIIVPIALFVSIFFFSFKFSLKIPLAKAEVGVLFISHNPPSEGELSYIFLHFTFCQF